MVRPIGHWKDAEGRTMYGTVPGRPGEFNLGPLRIREEFDGAGGITWFWSWSWTRRARNTALHLAAAKLETEAKAIIRAGDQFDQGGDIYSKAGYFLQAAEIVRSLIQ